MYRAETTALAWGAYTKSAMQTKNTPKNRFRREEIGTGTRNDEQVVGALPWSAVPKGYFGKQEA